MKPKYKVKTLKGEEIQKLPIALDSCPSAGPHPNITGMKKQFWGMDACCIKIGAYVYKVPYHVWKMF